MSNIKATVKTNDRLKPPKNRRWVVPHVCATCIHFKFEEVTRVNNFEPRVDTECGCERPQGIIEDGSELDNFYFMTCDYWKEDPEL